MWTFGFYLCFPHFLKPRGCKADTWFFREISTSGAEQKRRPRGCCLNDQWAPVVAERRRQTNRKAALPVDIMKTSYGGYMQEMEGTALRLRRNRVQFECEDVLLCAISSVQEKKAEVSLRPTSAVQVHIFKGKLYLKFLKNNVNNHPVCFYGKNLIICCRSRRH